jgi:hypothetical protein
MASQRSRAARPSASLRLRAASLFVAAFPPASARKVLRKGTRHQGGRKMGHDRHRQHGKSATLKQDLQHALFRTVLQFGDAVRRLERHRRQRGYDYRCRRLLDEVHLSRSLLFVLADEVKGEGGSGPHPARG